MKKWHQHQQNIYEKKSETTISVPASIIFITLLWIGKETIWFWALRRCWNFFIFICGFCCGSRFLCGSICSVCFAMWKVRFSWWFVFCSYQGWNKRKKEIFLYAWMLRVVHKNNKKKIHFRMLCWNCHKRMTLIWSMEITWLATKCRLKLNYCISIMNGVTFDYIDSINTDVCVCVNMNHLIWLFSMSAFKMSEISDGKKNKIKRDVCFERAIKKTWI